MNNYSRLGVEQELHRHSAGARRRSHRGKKVEHALALLLIIAVIGAFAVLVSIGIGAFQSIISSAPDISNINVTPTGYATFVYDDEGTQTAKLVATDANRIPVTMDMIPEDLQHAFVAIEDSRFYEHHGIDTQGILRAAYEGITSGSFSQGASTITQQLIKNSVFTGWTDENFSESVRRKIQEQYLAVQLEKTMSKDDILLNYLNTINLGHNTLGVQAASLRYFGKSCSQLTLSEDAVIAAITQNPTRYDPINYPDQNAKRRKVVLDDMLDQGWITQDAYDEAIADDVYDRIQIVNSADEDDTQVNSYFVDALTDQILEDLQDKGYTETQAYTLLYSGGLSIYSTQNAGIQEICDEEANNEELYPAGTKWYLNYALNVEDAEGTVHSYSSNTLLDWMKQNGISNTLLFPDQDSASAMVEQYKASVVSDTDTVLSETEYCTAQPQVSLTFIDQKTGHVLAIVGGRGDKTASRTLNRATSTLRQPGSTFKVVSTYAAALDAGGKTLATTYVDEPFTYENGTPVRNWYGEAYRGTTTIRKAIEQSMNIIAVKCLTDITPQLGYQYLLDFGFTTLVNNEEINGQVYNDVQQTMALGGLTRGVKNIELCAAYATIANGGVYEEPKFYTKVVDPSGNVVLDADAEKDEHRVLREGTAYLLTSAMEDVVKQGTGTRCQISETPVAGKTGTTSDENDVWFAGYSDYYTCTTWAGYDENTNLVGAESRIAQLLWHNVMERVHEGFVSREFEVPATVEKTSICTRSWLKPVKGLCDYTLATDYFDMTTYPTQECNASYHSYSGYSYSGYSSTEKSTGEESGSSSSSSSGGDVSSAQSALASANSNLESAAAALKSQQDALVAAQAAGDQNAIATAQQAVDTATTNYNTAVAQQAAAESAYNAALSASQSAGDGGGGGSAGGE